MTKPPALRDLMPEMTDREDDFVLEFVQTGDAVRAASVAGYAQPEIQGRAIAKRPRVAAAIRIETARRMQHMAPVALNVLYKAATNDSVPWGARVDAAKTILDRSGYVSDPKRTDRSDDNKPLAEYSVEELERLVERLEEQRAASAKDVSAPLLRANDDQPIDPLE